MEDFDGGADADVFAEGFVDDTHAALADLLHQAIVSDDLADHEIWHKGAAVPSAQTRTMMAVSHDEAQPDKAFLFKAYRVKGAAWRASSRSQL